MCLFFIWFMWEWCFWFRSLCLTSASMDMVTFRIAHLHLQLRAAVWLALCLALLQVQITTWRRVCISEFQGPATRTSRCASLCTSALLVQVFRRSCHNCTYLYTLYCYVCCHMFSWLLEIACAGARMTELTMLLFLYIPVQFWWWRFVKICEDMSIS